MIFAFAGLIGANLIGTLVGVVILANAYLHSSGYAFFANVQFPQLILQAIVGTFTLAFGRGAITWIALNTGDERASNVRAAFLATRKRLPTLVAQSLVYGTLLTLALGGLVLMLRDLRLDVGSVGRVNISLNAMTRAVAVRALNTTIPDPGSPFTEIQTYLRTPLGRSNGFSFGRPAAEAPSGLWLIGLASIVLAIVVETLFRLRTVMLMRAEGMDTIGSMIASLRAGWRHFGYIAASTWLLRLVFVGISLVFIAVPMTFVQSMFVPILSRQLSSFWPYPGSSLLFTFGGALVGAILAALEVVYDTRIYAAVMRRA